MTTARRRAVVIGLIVMLVVVVPAVVLGVGRFSAFDILGQDDPLGDPDAKIDLVACFREGIDRFRPHEIADEALSVPQRHGGSDLLPGVDGFSLASTDGQRTDVLLVDFYFNASAAEVDAVESALLDYPEVAAVMRHTQRSACTTVGSSTSTTG